MAGSVINNGNMLIITFTKKLLYYLVYLVYVF